VSQIKRAALDALRADLAANVTGMSAAGKVAAVARDAFRDAPQPSIQLVPLRTTFEWTRPQAISSLSGQRGLWRAGRMAADVQIRVVSRTPKEREPIEEQVIARFAPRSGTLHLSTGALTLSGIATGYSAPVAVGLDRELWEEEKTQERRRYSYLDTTLTTEVLYVSATGTVPTIASIILHVTHDMKTAYPAVKRKNYQVTTGGVLVPLP